MSSMAFGGSLAGISRVAFEATGVGETTRDIERVAAAYRHGNQEMSDSALKVALAQRRLESALKAGPAAVDRQARAELNLRRAEQELRGETDRLTASATHNERALGRLGRGAVAGSGLFRGLGRSVAFASSSFLGGVGFVYALRQTLGAAKQSEVIYGRLGQAVRNVGLSWADHRAEVEKALLAQSKMSAFDDEELAQSLAQLVVRTKDVNRALELNALVADVARGRNMSLDSAMKLVLKASIGNSGALRRLGIDISKNATATQILAALQAKFGGQAKRYASEAQGAQDRWNVSLQNSEEIIGRALTPSIARLFREGANWLDELNRSGRLQRDVNEAVQTGSQVIRGFAGGVRLVRAALSPIVHLLGGAENAAELFTLAFAASKLAGGIKAIGALRLALAGIGPTAAASGATAVVAENAIGTAALVNARRVGTLRAALLSLPGLAGLTVGTLFAYPFGKRLGEQSAHAFFQKIGLEHKPEQFRDLERKARAGTITQRDIARARSRGDITQDQMEALIYILQAAQARRSLGGKVPSLAELERQYAASRKGSSRGGGRGAGSGISRTPGRSEADILLSIARAQTTAGTADDLRYERELLARYRTQAAALERRKNLSQKQKQRLTDLYGQIASVQGQIDSIISENERKLDDRRKAAAEKRRREREARARRNAQAIAAAEKRAAALERQIGTPYGLSAAGLASVAKAAKAAKKGATGGVNQDDVRREIHDILAGLRGVISDFGSNFAADGPAAKQTATHAHAQTELLRDQNRKLDRLVASMWHPGTRFAEAELSVAGLGVGF